MEHNEISRLDIDKKVLGPGNWEEMLSVFCDKGKDSPNARILYFAKFGIFEDVKAWGRMLATMVRTIASGEAAQRGLKESDAEVMEAKIVEGFNDIMIGTDSIKIIREGYVGDEKNPNSPDRNWNPGENNWQG